MEFLKSAAGKVLTAALVLAVAAAAISWWQADEQTRDALLRGAGRVVAWIGVVAVMPWATFFASVRAARTGSNAAGAMLVAGYTLLGLLLLLWLFDFHFGGALGWALAVAAVLTAGVYNLLACDFIADRLDG